MENTAFEKETEKALLISVDTGEFDAEVSINELAELADTAGAEVAGMMVQKKGFSLCGNLCRIRPAL